MSHYIDTLAHNYGISSADAMEILQSYTKPSICDTYSQHAYKSL